MPVTITVFDENFTHVTTADGVDDSESMILSLSAESDLTHFSVNTIWCDTVTVSRVWK